MGVGPLHRRMGLAAIAVFLLTGLFLRLDPPHFHGGGDAVRFLYRANHVYILLAGLVHLALGLHLERTGSGWRGRLQLGGSAAMLAAVPLLIAAFFREPPSASPHRPLTSLGVLLLFTGLLCHLPGRTAHDEG